MICSTVNDHLLIKSRSSLDQSENEECERGTQFAVGSLALSTSGICCVLLGLMGDVSFLVAERIAPANATANAADEPSPAPMGSCDVIVKYNPPHVLYNYVIHYKKQTIYVYMYIHTVYILMYIRTITK